MNCPKCKDAGLTRKENKTLYECLRCGGLWWEGLAFHRLEEISNYISGGHRKPEHDLKTGLCPQGHGILTRAKVESDQSFYLEKCSTCHGIWFDKDEWSKISESQLENNLLNLWSFSWKKEQRLKREEKALRKTYEQALGEGLYLEIVQVAHKIKAHPEKYRALTLFNEELKKQDK